MRKVFALSILIVVFIPLAFSAMTLTSVRPWILDRNFYERLVSDERLYEFPMTDDLANRFDEDVFTTREQLPVSALAVALREVATPDYVRTQTLRIVDEVFSFVEGRHTSFTVSLDITPVKGALAGEDGGRRFASALAGALPTCSAGQTPIAPEGRLTRCIADGEAVETASAQIAAALPAALEAMPDQIVVDSRDYVRLNGYDYAWFLGSGIHGVLDVAILMVICTTIGVWLIGASLGGDDLQSRLKWLSSSLYFPASLFLLAGLALALPMTADAIRYGVQSANWVGAQYSDAYREAVVAVIVPAVQQIDAGILLTGGVTFLAATILLILSFVTTAQGQGAAKYVQIPAQNA